MSNFIGILKSFFFFFLNKIKVFYTLGKVIYPAVHEDNTVLNDPLSHKQSPAGKTGASTLVTLLPRRDLKASPTTGIMHTHNKSKL